MITKLIELDTNIITLVILEGYYKSDYSFKSSLDDWDNLLVEPIVEIDDDFSTDKETYYQVDLYHGYGSVRECYSNGRLYHTSRIIKVSDYQRVMRREKLKKLKICRY